MGNNLGDIKVTGHRILEKKLPTKKLFLIFANEYQLNTLKCFKSKTLLIEK